MIPLTRSIIIAFACATSWSAFAGVDVTTFGATGDGETDDTAAIRRAFAAHRSIHFPAGIYVITDGLELPDSAIITGDGSPTLGTFPLKDDDKRFLTTAGHEGLPGTVLLFRGSGKASLDSGRSDEFESLRYAVKTATQFPWQISDLAIVLDVAAQQDSGRPTLPEDDQSADFDVGLLVDDSPGGALRNVSIFGYFAKAGLCVLSREMGSNPDYNTFWNSSFSGNYGVALLGSDDAPGPGLSGTQFYGCNLFSNDHHSRKETDWGDGALFIDGNTSARRDEINGHYFFGGCVRTYNNTAVSLNHATNVGFHGVIFEVPGFDREPNDGLDKTGRVVGTKNTGDVAFFGCRMHDIGLNELAAVMEQGSVLIAGAGQEGILFQSGNHAARIHATATGDPLLQLTNEPGSVTTGWTMRMDVSADEAFVLRHNNLRKLSIDQAGVMKVDQIDQRIQTIGRSKHVEVKNGVIPFAASRMTLQNGESSALHTIEGGTEGAVLQLEASSEASGLTIAKGTSGNIRVTADHVWDHLHDSLTLVRRGDLWVETARADF